MQLLIPLLTAAMLTLSACGDSTSTPPASDTGVSDTGGSADTGASDTGQSPDTGLTALDELCLAGMAACSTVTLAECRQIVNNANVVVTKVDITCMQVATSCADTSMCLDRMTNGNPGSQPSN